MGFTIQDMLISSKIQYQMDLVGGSKGWSNSISWVLMVEDTEIIKNFSGKELVVTTGLGFNTEEKLLDLAEKLFKKHAAGLIINTGEYVMEIPESLIEFCNNNDLPLINVPWEIYLADMIKDLSIRIFMQGSADEQISDAMIRAIETPDNQDSYRKELLQYFDVDGEFEVVLFSTGELDEMDTVERRKLANRLQILLENITHNGNFFYYDGYFALVMNNVSEEDKEEILSGMIQRTKKRMPEICMHVGVGNRVVDISLLHESYKRAKAAVLRAIHEEVDRIDFTKMGIHRLLYSVTDNHLLEEMLNEALSPIIEYDKKHNSNYMDTLEMYLKYDGSIQAVADKMYTHRNTVIYRINNIKKILDTDFSTQEDKLKYQIAFYIRNM